MKYTVNISDHNGVRKVAEFEAVDDQDAALKASRAMKDEFRRDPRLSGKVEIRCEDGSLLGEPLPAGDFDPGRRRAGYAFFVRTPRGEGGDFVEELFFVAETDLANACARVAATVGANVEVNHAGDVTERTIVDYFKMQPGEVRSVPYFPQRR
jgi:hypothetical protein